MGTVITRSSSVDRIFGDFDETAQNGALAADNIKAAVAARLGPLQPTVTTARGDLESAEAHAVIREKELMFADGASDLEIGAALDEAWNALGRPASSVDYTLIAGTGKAQWTDGDPRDQAALMTVLAARFRNSTAPALQAGKEGWAQRIEAKAAPQQVAADALKAAELHVTVAKGIARGIADLAQVALARLKRDLANLGLTEAQIHQIIPDYVPKPKAAKATAAPAAPAAPAPPAEPKPA